MPISVIEIIGSREGSETTDAQFVRRFVVRGVSITDALDDNIVGVGYDMGNPSAGVPSLGFEYPDRPSLHAFDRRPVYRGPLDTLVEVYYARVSWHGDNVYRVRTEGNPPYRQESSRSAEVFQSVTRVQTRDPAPPLTGIDFLEFSVPVRRPSSIYTVKLHTDLWTNVIGAAVRGELGKQHEGLNVGDDVAMFESFDVRPIGKDLWEVTYNWRLQGPMRALDGQVIIDPTGTLFPVQNDEDFYPAGPLFGAFPPHTMPRKVQFSAFMGGVPPDPVYIQDRPAPPVGNISNLPGYEDS